MQARGERYPQVEDAGVAKRKKEQADKGHVPSRPDVSTTRTSGGTFRPEFPIETRIFLGQLLIRLCLLVLVG